MNVQADIEAVVDVSDAGRLRRVLGEPDRETARAEIKGWTSQQWQSSGRGIDLTAAALTGADLSSLNLRGVTLSRATLNDACLDGANLAGGRLVCPAMEKTSLRGATVSGAYLHALAAQACDFTQADLKSVLDATGSLFHAAGSSRRAWITARSPEQPSTSAICGARAGTTRRSRERHSTSACSMMPASAPPTSIRSR
jgi:uncharacterized protein YjbI with pentapeptide repeats